MPLQNLETVQASLKKIDIDQKSLKTIENDQETLIQSLLGNINMRMRL